ncbi:nucleoporin protein Ndc1-Nup [Lasiosphaeria hispida]|uniref:Nucleoporin protein Ndc1-Nup n=1 Tax=Lasiosphaeria hispida TaxID=260671 RepID=A0AAJ0HA23_9PEZI|nr:nucleoporin protein Ndc1-Nup [Lasiosphaeria hispida]
MAAATVRRPAYKDFLQPALHRRFSSSAGLLLGIGYLYGIALANWNSLLWSWFPIGPTGVRGVLLAFCGFVIIILRVAQYHVGLRTSDSAFQTFVHHAAKLQTAEAIFTYVLSAYVFSQVYLWSLSESAGLEWITYFMSDRARLNEKTLFFTAHFVILGVYQGLLHVFKDVDHVSLGVARPRNEDGDGGSKGGDDSYWKRFADQMPLKVLWAFNQSLVGLLLSIVVYQMFLRATLWRVMLLFLRPIYNLPRTNLLPASWPFSFTSLSRSFIASFLLLFLWTTGNLAFSTFLVKEPLKNGKPLTSESKDPNGSLLNGLKGKKLAIQCFAMWELAFIARDYPERRAAIYEDLDRKDGPMWSQVYGICLEVLKGLETRIDNHGKAPAPATPAAAPVELKKRTTQPPKEDAIFQGTPPKKNFRVEVEKVVNGVTTVPGQGSQLSPMAKRALATAKQQALKVQKEVTGTEDTQTVFRDLALKILNSAVGWPFRQEYGRRLAHTVLGEPYGEPSLYINATYALSQLAAHSLTEDKYGNVQRDIATTIRSLTAVTKKLDAFITTLSTHWTDVEGKKESGEVRTILDALKESLGLLVREFSPYARDLRLSMTDMRLAREAAGVASPEQPSVPLETRQVR